MSKGIYGEKRLRMSRWRSNKWDNIIKVKEINVIVNIFWCLFRVRYFVYISGNLILKVVL